MMSGEQSLTLLEARAEVCDESKTTVGKIDDKSCHCYALRC